MVRAAIMAAPAMALLLWSVGAQAAAESSGMSIPTIATDDLTVTNTLLSGVLVYVVAQLRSGGTAVFNLVNRAVVAIEKDGGITITHRVDFSKDAYRVMSRFSKASQDLATVAKDAADDNSAGFRDTSWQAAGDRTGWEDEADEQTPKATSARWRR